MLISEIAARMPIWFESGNAVTLIGSSGIGKTSLMLEAPAIIRAATGKRISVVIFNCATYTPMHMLGFGVVRHFESPDGEPWSEMHFSDPFFFRTTLENMRLSEFPDGGIIVADEVDKSDPDVAKNLGELAYSKTIGTHRLAPNWCVWMSGNPADARYGSKKQLDYLINRQCIIPVRSDPQGWTDWGIRRGLLPATLAFAETHAGVVFADTLPEKQGPWCTPRSLADGLDRHLQAAMRVGNLKAPPDDDATIEEAEGYIGAAAQPYFLMLKQSLGMPTLPEILADPEGCRLPTADCMALLCYNVAFTVQAKDIGKLIKYIDRLPREFASTFMRAAVHKNPKLITAKELGAWAQKNAQLLLLFSKYSTR